MLRRMRGRRSEYGGDRSRASAKTSDDTPGGGARQLGVAPGDRLVIEMDADRPGEVRLRPVRRSYAGALGGVFGSAAEVTRYLQEERASWSE